MEYAITIAVPLSIYAVLASSTNVLLGHGGLLSISQGAVYGIGAYASALASMKLGLPFPLAMLSAAAFCAACAAVMAIPLLRLQGDYFILGSLGFQILIIDFIRNADDITNGTLGLSGIPRPVLFGWEPSTPRDFAALYALVAVLAVAAFHYLLSSPFGRALRAVRDDAQAAEGFGKNVSSIQIKAFALSAAGAGVAGAMYAHYINYIDATSFLFAESIYILSMVIIGGVATTTGPIIGACILVIVPELLRFVGFSSGLDSYIRQLLYGVLLIVFAFTRPNGIAGKRVF